MAWRLVPTPAVPLSSPLLATLLFVHGNASFLFRPCSVVAVLCPSSHHTSAVSLCCSPNAPHGLRGKAQVFSLPSAPLAGACLPVQRFLLRMEMNRHSSHPEIWYELKWNVVDKACPRSCYNISVLKPRTQVTQRPTSGAPTGEAQGSTILICATTCPYVAGILNV